MRFRIVVLSLAITMAAGLLITVQAGLLSPSVGPTVRITASVTDTSGGVLTYRWRSTDGSINDVNSATTTWTLPTGPGLHFAYLLVSNGRGGYSERRLVVNSDVIGVPTPPPNGSLPLTAPPASAQQGDYFRGFLAWGQSFTATTYGAFQSYVNVPNIPVYLQDTTTNALSPPTGSVLTNAKGEFTVPGFPSESDLFNIFCSFDNGTTFSICAADYLMFITPHPAATTEYFSITPAVPAINGSLFLADGNPCGTQNEFFGVHSTASATLTDASSNVLASVRVSELGFYALPVKSNAASVLLRCEGAAPLSILLSKPPNPSGVDLGPRKVAKATAPTIVSMTAILNGKVVGSMLPPPSGFPSDLFARSDQFLAEKGLDSRLGACRYYKAVGAVQSCDAQGNFTGAVTFDDWQRATKMGPYALPGFTEYTAAYINRVDLNLARVHHSISYSPNQTAAYVCNHLGPPGATPLQLMNPSQTDVDTAVANALANKNLVACVAMDYTVNPGVNNDQPFIRFLIFGPNGQLLPSINLDGRREKFVPGTCVVCHGGDHYAGKFPEDGSGFANVGGHFLPYDTGNFDFSSQPGLREADQSVAIYHLNQNILNAGPTPAEQNLVANWYANGTTLDKNYLPTSWQNQGLDSVYRDFVARSCRTCHVALADDYYNFDNENNFFGDYVTCGGPNSSNLLRSHSMPNSLVTFNRFWLSGTSVDPSPVDQVALMNLWVGSNRCVRGLTP